MHAPDQLQPDGERMDYNKLSEYVGLWGTCSRCGELVEAEGLDVLDDEAIAFDGRESWIDDEGLIVCSDCMSEVGKAMGRGEREEG